MRPAPIGRHKNKIQIQPMGGNFRGGGSIVEFRLPGTLLAALQDSRRFISPPCSRIFHHVLAILQENQSALFRAKPTKFLVREPTLGLLLRSAVSQLATAATRWVQWLFSLVPNIKSAQLFDISAFSKRLPIRRSTPKFAYSTKCENRYEKQNVPDW